MDRKCKRWKHLNVLLDYCSGSLVFTPGLVSCGVLILGLWGMSGKMGVIERIVGLPGMTMMPVC